MDPERTDALTRADPIAAQLPWPPPGLERLHGALWSTISAFALADFIFAVPLFLAIGRRQHFASLGAFGGAYWLPVVTTLLGTIFLLTASLRLARGLRTASRAAELGYDRPTILLTWSDAGHQHGELLRGSGRFAALEPPARNILRFLRLAAPLAYLCALTWIPAALTMVLLLAYFNTMSASTLWLVSLVPPTLLGLVGWMMRAVDGMIMRAAKPTPKAELVERTRSEAERWQARLHGADDDQDAPPATAMRAKPFRIAATLVVLLFSAAFLLVAVVAYVTAVGPFAAHHSSVPAGTWRYSTLPLAGLNRYALPADSSISPTAASAALRDLVAAGLQLRTLDRRTAAILHGLNYGLRGEPLLQAAHERRLTTEQQQGIARLAQHAGVAPLRTLARAPAIDVFAAFLPDSVALLDRMDERYWRRYVQARNVIEAHIARAAYQMQEREVDNAEQTLRELISTGRLLMRDGPTGLEYSIGSRMALAGLTGLAGYYRVFGRTAEADLVESRAQTHRTAEPYGLDDPSAADARLMGTSRVLRQPNLTRAALWESYYSLNQLAPCLNLRHAFFPRDSVFEAWKSTMRKTLIRFPSDSVVLALLDRRVSAAATTGFERCPRPRYLQMMIRARWPN